MTTLQRIDRAVHPGLMAGFPIATRTDSSSIRLWLTKVKYARAAAPLRSLRRSRSAKGLLKVVATTLWSSIWRREIGSTGGQHVGSGQLQAARRMAQRPLVCDRQVGE